VNWEHGFRSRTRTNNGRFRDRLEAAAARHPIPPAAPVCAKGFRGVHSTAAFLKKNPRLRYFVAIYQTKATDFRISSPLRTDVTFTTLHALTWHGAPRFWLCAVNLKMGSSGNWFIAWAPLTWAVPAVAPWAAPLSRDDLPPSYRARKTRLQRGSWL
jgi:hypothetical protein